MYVCMYCSFCFLLLSGSSTGMYCILYFVLNFFCILWHARYYEVLVRYYDTTSSTTRTLLVDCIAYSVTVWCIIRVYYSITRRHSMYINIVDIVLSTSRLDLIVYIYSASATSILRDYESSVFSIQYYIIVSVVFSSQKIINREIE